MELRLAFAYLGDITVELIEPLSGGISVYTNALPTEGFGVVLHHLGYVVEGTLETWESFSTGIPDESLLFEGAVDDHTRFLYQDTKALTGQHTEYLWWNDDRLAWLDDIPRN